MVELSFFECELAKAIWFGPLWDLYCHKSCRMWIGSLFSSSLDCTMFYQGAIIMQCIWKAKNKLIFNHMLISTENILEKAHQMIKDYNPELLSQPQKNVAELDDQMPKHWMPPPPGSLKINVDGTIALQCVVIAIVGDSSRSFIQGETKYLKPRYLEEAEAMTFYLGLGLVDDLPSIPILIEGDDSKTVNLINDKNILISWKISSQTIVVLLPITRKFLFHLFQEKATKQPTL